MNASVDGSMFEDAERSANRAVHPDYLDFADKSPEWVAEQRRELDNHAGRLPLLNANDRFPVKLHSMLSQMEEAGEVTIVGWQAHGRAFKIYDKHRFVKEVLPKFFKEMSKFASFQRQLNLYNFRRITGLTGSCAAEQKGYYHCLFLRGRPDLSSLMPRSKLASHSVRRTYDPNSEPDFSSMRPVGHPHASNGHTTSASDIQPQPQSSAQFSSNLESQARAGTSWIPTVNLSADTATSAQLPSLHGYSHLPSTFQSPAPAPLDITVSVPTQIFTNPTSATFPTGPHAATAFATFPTSEPIYPAPLQSTLQPLAHFTEPNGYQSYGCWQGSSLVPQVAHSQPALGNAATHRMGTTSALLSDQAFFNQAISSFQNSLYQALQPPSASLSSQPGYSMNHIPTGLQAVSDPVTSLPSNSVDAARDTYASHARRRHKRARPAVNLPPETSNDVDSSSSLDMSQASGKVMAEWLEDVDFDAKD